MLIEFQLIILAANGVDVALEATSVRGGTNPYISKAPTGAGASFDPNTGVVTSGAFTGRIVDPITSGTSRLFTSLLEDANGRQQMGHRRAFWKFRVDGGSWQTLYAGRLSRYRLASDIEWEITISDWMKAEHEYSVFDPAHDETITDFLARWPKRGCLCGGPVIGGFLTVPDRGGWKMRVRTDAGSNRYRLEPVSVYGPGAWVPGADIFRTPTADAGSAAARINAIAHGLPHGVHRFETLSFSTIRDLYQPGVEWPGLVTLIDGVPWRPISPAFGGVTYGKDNFQDSLIDIISGKPGQFGLFVYRDGQSALSAGDIVTVRVLTVLPSEVSPIYVDSHVIDFGAALWDDAGIPYDSASVETVRDTLGAAFYFAGRFTKPERLGPLLEAAVYGAPGIAARQGDDGELEPFCSRIFATSLPSVTITEADVVAGSTEAFELDTGKAIRRFRFEHDVFQPNPGGVAPDGIVIQAAPYERTNADPGAIGTGEVSYRVPGQIRLPQTIKQELLHWVDGRAYEIFDRSGRGPIGLRTTLLRGGAGDNVVLGQEILVDLPQLPNANKRLGDDASVSARAMQIVALTKTDIGKEIECIDSGPNATPYATAPTHTIAASSDRPRNVAHVTFTNAAALNADSAGLQLQMAIVSSGTPAVGEYSDIALFPPGEIPTSAFRLPAVVHNLDVFVRARSIKAGKRPSSWSTGVGVSLDVIDAPSSVTGTPNGSDATRAEVTWTNGSDAGAMLVEVWLSLDSETFDDAALIDTLPAGSNRYSLYDLAASEGYTVYIRHRDEETGDVSATAEDDFTQGASVATLAAPTNADGFSTVRRQPSRTFGLVAPLAEQLGRYGIVVKATELPGFVEVQEAVEDSPGAGTYGAFSTVATAIPSVAGDWTMWANVAPVDGKRRKLKARHVRDNATASSYTSEVVVTPGTNDPIPQFPLTDGSVALLTLSDAAKAALASGSLSLETDAEDVIINLSGPDQILSWKYAVSTSAIPSDSDVNSGTTENNRVARITKTNVVPNLGDRYYVKARPFTGASAGGTGGPYFTAEVERQNKATTKTLRFPHAEFTQANEAADFSRGAVGVGPASKTNILLWKSLVLPVGAEMTAFRSRLRRQNGNGVASAELRSVTDAESVSTIATNTHSTSGYQTQTSAIAETVPGNVYYVVLVELDTTAATNATDNSLMWVEIDYEVPDLETTY